MMHLGAPSISKYGSLVRPDAQIVALRAHCTRTALKAPPQDSLNIHKNCHTIMKKLHITIIKCRSTYFTTGVRGGSLHCASTVCYFLEHTFPKKPPNCWPPNCKLN